MLKTRKNNLVIIFAGLVLLFSLYACNKKDNAAPANTVTDADGNVYKFVKIGKQIWMAENLKTTQYNNKTKIRDAQSDTAWINSNLNNRADSGAYCWYNTHDGTKDSLITKYGRLYNFYAVNTGNLCPIGWHVPSDGDWKILTDTLINLGLNATALKDKRWTNTIANNVTGFSALPGGSRDISGPFGNIEQITYWWTSTLISNTGTFVAYIRELDYNNMNITKQGFPYTSGFSVRCVKN